MYISWLPFECRTFIPILMHFINLVLIQMKVELLTECKLRYITNSCYTRIIMYESYKAQFNSLKMFVNVYSLMMAL
jgi:hypothetical protein